ncbi:uncharacterized protein [Parasteatoda tepidariorum]|uniref:uncharacterized protein isoform X2 n=1 Tax=Parasteatoda tepidariorum TaxID=114398 RepID=UPI001C7278DE|nr:uncharacterized protein LOC107450387 isoform X2 [Parasteatoda tepidariorum]
MANLKRHFNFTKSSINQERDMTFPISSSGKSSYRDFDKNNLMNDIRNCLDVCCCYIQVIGTCLSSFIELQAQFSLTTWKSLSKLSKNFTSDSVRHGLQWKSLERNPSKISVNTDLNATIKKHFSHIFKVGNLKTNEPTEHQQYHSSPISAATNMSVYSPFGTPAVTDSSSSNSVWPTPTSIWTSSDTKTVNYSRSNGSPEQDPLNGSPNNIDLDEVINLLSCVPAQQTGTKANSQNYLSMCSNSEQMYHLLPKVSVPPISRRLNSHRSWTKEPRDLFGNDSWIWRIDNMNCSGLPRNEDILKLCNEANKDIQTHWENKELQKWNSSICETGSSSDDGSSVNGPDTDFHPGIGGSFGKHLLLSLSNRKQSSGESMPGGLENISESKEECLWATHSKISTWPLKQSAFRNSDGECQERAEYLQYPNHYFTSS